MRILICDDEPVVVRQISRIIKDAYPDFEIVGIHSSAELSQRLAQEREKVSFDIAFLDIALKGESGLSMAEFVAKYSPKTKIVFVSGNQNLVSRAFTSVTDCGYIYKPINLAFVLGYIDRVAKNSGKSRNEEYFEFFERGRLMRIAAESILFIESDRNRIKLYFTSGEVKEILCRLDTAEEQLERSFVRCHKSFLVNLKYIAKYSSTAFTLMNGEVIRISRGRQESAVEKYLLFRGVSV